MNPGKRFRSLLLVGLLLGSGVLLIAKQAEGQDSNAADNTKVNQRDRNAS